MKSMNNMRNEVPAKVGQASSLPLDRQDARPTLLVAESGIHSRADVERLKQCGAKAVLVGESLMKHGDIGTKVRELMRESS